MIICPFCYSGYTFHKTYGTEKKCLHCNGTGKILETKLKQLNWTKSEINFFKDGFEQ